jgi:acyl carrier protein
MIITLEPNQSIEIRFAHGRNEHGDPIVSDGVITVRHDNEKKRIRIVASEADSSGRCGVVYQEDYGIRLEEAKTEALSLKEQQLLDKIRRIVSEHVGHDPELVKPEASIIDDLGADSLDQVELVIAFEEEFDIAIPDDVAEGMITIGDVLSYLRSRV